VVEEGGKKPIGVGMTPNKGPHNTELHENDGVGNGKTAMALK